MKRSEIVSEIKSVIATVGPTQPTIVTAEQVLHVLEALGMAYTEDNEIFPYEPEVGWDKFFELKEKEDEARDFQIVLHSNEFKTRGPQIAQKFLDGKSFKDLAEEYNVTLERVRQIVCKQRRRYQRSLEAK